MTRGLAVLMGVALIAGCASLPENVKRTVSSAYTETHDTALGRYGSRKLAPHPGRSGFVLLENGLDAFVARAVLAGKAEVSIDAQYYLLHNDLTGKLFLYQLGKAADRGVRVRLLLDDMDLGGRDLAAALIGSHPNISLRLFNPFSRKSGRGLQLLTRFGTVTRRTQWPSGSSRFCQASLFGCNSGGTEMAVSGSFGMVWRGVRSRCSAATPTRALGLVSGSES